MKPAVHTLTYDQAVDELVALCDSRPSEDNPRALQHWKEENSQRAVDLEAWILMKTPKDAAPGPDPLPEAAPLQDAPPHHLQEASVPQPEPKKLGPKPKSPNVRLAGQVEAYHGLIAQLATKTGDRTLRKAAATSRSRILAFCKEFKLHTPALEPLPEIAEPKKPGRKAMPAPVPPKKVHDPACGSAGLSSAPLTVEALVVTTAARAREVAQGLLDAQGANVVTPEPESAPEPAPVPHVTALHVRQQLRAIRRDLLHVLPQIEGLDDLGRDVIREDLEVLDNLVYSASSMAQEAGIHMAG